MSLLSLDDAKTHLNITSNTDDAEIADTIAEAEAIISRQIGSLESTETTIRIPGWTDLLLLPAGRVVSLTSITPVNGTALDLSLLLFDPIAGTVVYTNGFSRFYARAYDVVFDAGFDDPPADLLRAVKEMVEHLWTPQRGGVRASSNNEAPTPGYLFPPRVAELLEPYIPLGIA